MVVKKLFLPLQRKPKLRIMDNKIKAIYNAAKKNGWSIKYRKIARKNMYLLSFFANDFLDGFAFSVIVNDNEDYNIFLENVSNAIYDNWKDFSVEDETEKYLAKIGCKNRFSHQANKIYMEVNYYIYNIYSIIFNLAKK